MANEEDSKCLVLVVLCYNVGTYSIVPIIIMPIKSNLHHEVSSYRQQHFDGNSALASLLRVEFSKNVVEMDGKPNEHPRHVTCTSRSNRLESSLTILCTCLASTISISNTSSTMKLGLPNTRTNFRGRSAAGAKGESEATLNVGTPSSRNTNGRGALPPFSCNHKQGKDNALAYSGSETAYYQDYIDDGTIKSSESFAKVMKDNGKRNVQIVFPLPTQEDSIHENSSDENNAVVKSNQEPNTQEASEVIGSYSSGFESALNRFESVQLELNQTDHVKSSPQPETNHSVELQTFDAQ